jgi:hypothetical protein
MRRGRKGPARTRILTIGIVGNAEKPEGVRMKQLSATFFLLLFAFGLAGHATEPDGCKGPCYLIPMHVRTDNPGSEVRQCGRYFAVFPLRSGPAVMFKIRTSGKPAAEIANVSDFVVAPDDGQEIPTVEHQPDGKLLLLISHRDLSEATCLPQR